MQINNLSGHEVSPPIFIHWYLRLIEGGREEGYSGCGAEDRPCTQLYSHAGSLVTFRWKVNCFWLTCWSSDGTYPVLVVAQSTWSLAVLN